ncbi:MAG TPA: SPOR domain-containing protein [Thermoanaerobaculia bacterium]
MDDHVDDASHYEISLTPGQAFIAFILLLCSLGAAFAFGIMVGRGQLDERLVVRREPAVVGEGDTPGEAGRIVELGVEDDFGSTTATPGDTTGTETAATEMPTIQELAPAAPSPEGAPAPVVETAQPAPAHAPPAADGPVYAQLLSSSDQKPAEALATKLIESGFTSAYVERVRADGSMIYRVRVRFPSEAQARAAVERLKTLAGGGDVWITRQ